MEIALKSVAIIAVVTMVLVAVGFFVLSQSGSSGTSASYDRIFFTKCEQIAQDGCNIDFVDNEFVNSCKYKFGQEQDKATCLYQFCSSCRLSESFKEMSCISECRTIRTEKGAALPSVDFTPRCLSYRSSCISYSCSACP